MEPGHPLHSALTRPSSAKTRRLNWSLPFVPAAQHLISLFDNSIRAAQWADYQWNGEWTVRPARLHFHPRHRPTPRNDPPQKSLGPAQPPLLQCWTFRLLLVQTGYGLLCVLWVWRRRTNRRPCCPPVSNPSTSPWTAWPDGAGRRDNWMAAQHLPRDLVRPSSGFNNSFKRSPLWSFITQNFDSACSRNSYSYSSHQRGL